MRAILTGVVATIEAIAVALASLLVVAGLAFLVWWLAFDLGSEPGEVFAGAGAAWLLAHFVPLSIELSPESMQLLGFAPDALRFTLSLVPLGITLVTVGFAVRAGWRLAARGGAGSAGVLGGALGFGAVAGVVHTAATLAEPGWFATVATAAAIYGLSSGSAYLARAAREEHPWWIAFVGAIETGLAKLNVPRPAVFPHRVGQTLRLAAMLVAGYVGISAVALAAALLTRFTAVIAASESLQLDVWGTLLMFVLQLALLPVLVLWTGSWLSGTGFAVGAGSSASPFGQLLGPMPGIPVLSAIPEGWGSAAVVAPLLLALVGLAIGVALGETVRRQTLPRLAIQVLGAALLAGLAIALGNWASSGSLGPGRLAVVGPETWTGAGLAAAALGLGCFLGALAARADIARRVTTAPSEVASRLGLGDEQIDRDGEDEGAHASGAGSAAAGVAGGADSTADSTAESAAESVAVAAPAGTHENGKGEPGDHRTAEPDSEPRLAPVSRLLPRLRRTAGNTRPDSEPQYSDSHTTDAFDTDAFDTGGVYSGGVDPDAQPTEPIAGATYGADDDAHWSPSEGELGPWQRATPEPELFDQHDAEEAPAVQPSSGHAADPRSGSGSEATSGAEAADPLLDPEALIEAYSWDGVDLDAAPPEEPKRTGWRWPRRKG